MRLAGRNRAPSRISNWKAHVEDYRVTVQKEWGPGACGAIILALNHLPGFYI